MKQLSILITLLISLGFSSACLGKVYNSLKVPNYKNIQLLVEQIPKNSFGLTREKVITITKLHLLRNGIKSAERTNPHLAIDIIAMDILVEGNIVGQTYHIKINLAMIDVEDVAIYEDVLSSKGALFIGNTYEDFERDLKNLLDQFLVDYLESNME
jgi:hypothetical protein